MAGPSHQQSDSANSRRSWSRLHPGNFPQGLGRMRRLQFQSAVQFLDVPKTLNALRIPKINIKRAYAAAAA